jgi:hypothetical protein
MRLSKLIRLLNETSTEKIQDIVDEFKARQAQAIKK